MSRIAIIPARGGSVRLPNKNIIDFLGKPIISYTINAALEADVFDEVVVSTDSHDIADIARTYGAAISMRGDDLSDGTARVSDVCVDLLEKKAREGWLYANFAVLYATAPLRNADDIKYTVDLIEPDICHSAVAVCDFDLPVQQALTLNKSGQAIPAFPELVKKRSDEVQHFFVDNGSTYALESESFKHYKNWFGPDVKCHFMPRSRSVDIDVHADLELARFYGEKIFQ